MKNLYLRILLTLVCFACSGIAVKAQNQDVDHLRVKMPFQFVLDGRTLPAGTYTVTPVTGVNSIGLILSDYDDHVSAIILPTQVENEYSSKTGFSLDQVGAQFVLRHIRTADHLFTIPVSDAPLTQLAIKSPGGASGSGTSTGK